MRDYGIHPRVLQSIREITYQEMLDELRDICGYAAKEGYDMQPVLDALEGQDPGDIDTARIKDAADRYYSPVPGFNGLQKIKPEYEEIAGYMQCICTGARHISVKQQMDAEGATA